MLKVNFIKVKIKKIMNYIIKNTNLLTHDDHLNYDDLFLKNLTSQNTSIYLRFWEVPYYCIILGRSNAVDVEVLKEKASLENVDITTRSSGGGTVVLGPGCLCYSLFIPTSLTEYNSISKTNKFVMNELKNALENEMENIHVKGVTDLCFGDKKFSGNAQRRLKYNILFHGTFLYNFNLKLISNLLQHPSKEPHYRLKRSHENFVTNIEISKKKLIQIISSQFNCVKEIKL